jgi:hypothetical protein
MNQLIYSYRGGDTWYVEVFSWAEEFFTRRICIFFDVKIFLFDGKGLVWLGLWNLMIGVTVLGTQE